MNTFFRTAIMICMVLLIFSLVANFIQGTGAFPVEGQPGPSISSTDDALTTLTGLDDPNMNAVFVGVTSLALLGVIVLAYFTRSMIPIGLFFFGEVFWTSWIRFTVVFSYGGYIPGDFILIFTVGVMFIFIAAIIGLLTGGG